MDSIVKALATIPQATSDVAPSNTPFRLSQLDFDPAGYVYIEVSEDVKVYKLLNEFIAENLIPEDATSFIVEDKRLASKITLRLGLGVFRFTWSGRTLRCLHQRREAGEEQASSLVLFAERTERHDAHDLLRGLCQELLDRSRKPAAAEKQQNSEVSIMKYASFLAGDGFGWVEETAFVGRPLTSVILPEETKARVTKDLDEFLSEGTAEFYRQHGIPLRRSYLLHGIPGSGKTSLIQAIANTYSLKLCYLVPSEPGMSDESLKAAVTRVPEQSIIVIEDIDALFRSRKKEGALMESADQWGFGSSFVNAITSSRVTLSGLLNALDGLGTACGQIVFLTTNHREHLDPALLRPGRVDVQVEFKHATSEQIKQMWSAFYPNDLKLAPDFASRVEAVIGGRQIATANLQSFFIQMRRKTGEEALLCVESIAQELKERSNDLDEEDEQGEHGAFESLFTRLTDYVGLQCCATLEAAPPERR